MQHSKKIGQSGFTLIELLIVVIILAVLASIAVPQFSSSTDDAKSAALDATLSELRNAIELYYHQHGEYPGANTDGTNAAGSSEAFVAQLTKYTTSAGVVSDTKTAQAKYGPYLKKQALPNNPMDGSNAIALFSTGSLTATGTNAGGWWFDHVSGKFMANISDLYTR